MNMGKIIKYSVTAVCIAALLTVCAVKVVYSARDTQAVTDKNGKVIIIDPGHGGSDPGAVSDKGTKESALNMQISLYLREYLLSAGFVVLMTRGDDSIPGADTGISNAERKRFLQQNKCDMVVSIHINKFSDKNVHGAETLYYAESEESQRLAQCIQTSLINELDKTNTRTIKGVTDLFVLKMNTSPSVLVECGYISNPTEESKLTSTSYQRRVAFAIYCGILSYLQN